MPNLTFGPQMVQRIQDVSPVPLDVHLMIENPERWAADYAKTGADCVTFHVEATAEPLSVIRAIHEAGSKAGISVKPGTPIEPFLELVGEVEQILVMTVEPGFGGQSFMADMMPKVIAVAEYAKERGLSPWIQVDGGISVETIGVAARAGANTFVAGSSVYATDVEPGEAISRLRAAADAAVTG